MLIWDEGTEATGRVSTSMKRPPVGFGGERPDIHVGEGADGGTCEAGCEVYQIQEKGDAALAGAVAVDAQPAGEDGCAARGKGREGGDDPRVGGADRRLGRREDAGCAQHSAEKMGGAERPGEREAHEPGWGDGIVVERGGGEREDGLQVRKG